MKKVLVIGGGAMGSAFTVPCLDNNNKVTITEPYSKKFIKDLSSLKKFHSSLKINLSKKFPKAPPNTNKSAYFLKIANDEKLKIQPSDIQRKLNTGEYFRNLKIDQNLNFKKVEDSNRYLFIVGMPRCGSTLLESILSLNPEVKDLGEVSFLEESLQKSNDFHEVKKLYKEKVMLINSKQKIFTDKNLFNFLYCS